MLIRRPSNLLPVVLLILAQPLSPFAKQSQTARADASQSQDNTGKTSQNTNEGAQHTPRNAGDQAARLRRILPVLPSLIRGGDGLLSTEGQRATQSQFVTSTNVKDPVTDAFPFTAGLPVETANPVQIPTEQFSVSLAKFYATVPVADSIGANGWNFTMGSPFFAIARADRAWRGVRSAAPMAAATGSLFGGRLSLYQSFAYDFSRQTVESILATKNDSRFQSYDSNTHVDIHAARGHLMSSRLALFSQDIGFATLNALTVPEATPNYLMRGGQLSFSDAYTTQNGLVLDSSVSYKKVLVRVQPRGSGPMVFVEQGEIFGNYFDNVHHDGNRFEWKEGLQLPEKRGWGNHRLGFGGGLARAAFESARVGNKIVLTGEEADELFSVTTFTGSPFESLSEHEMTGWAEDRWSPGRRASLTAGLRYDWTTLSRRSQWAPRAGFALLPFRSDRTVIRGGAGVFYDILPLTAGTFTHSRQRVMEFFEEAAPISEPRALDNLTTRANLKTPHLLGWNLELDQQAASRLFLRVKAEERRGRNLLLLNPDKSGRSVTALVLSDNGTSRYRELEATASYRLSRWSNLNGSYVRSSSQGDLGTFNAVMGTFEKLVISSSRYAHSRSDAPNRFLIWGDVRVPGSVMVSSAVDVHTGFPYAFFDADNKIPTEVDFSRFPRTFSLDLGLYRDLKVMAFDRQGRLRLGVRVYNLTNHFNPRDVELDHGHSAETEDQLFVKGYFNGARRTYRASATFNF